jgi:hypothetical protein
MSFVSIHHPLREAPEEPERLVHLDRCLRRDGVLLMDHSFGRQGHLVPRDVQVDGQSFPRAELHEFRNKFEDLVHGLLRRDLEDAALDPQCSGLPS